MSQRVTIEQLADWLRKREDIALFGHVSPDGDATGSTLALWHALRAMGKRAVVCLPDGIPLLYAMLPGADNIVNTEEPLPFVPQTALAVDVSEIERLGDAGMALFQSCPDQAALDHHFTNPGFGQLYMLDGEAAASGELVVDLIEALGVHLDEAMAECLFVAISTDSGHFNYSNTRPQKALSHPDGGAHQAAGHRAGGAGAVPGRHAELGAADPKDAARLPRRQGGQRGHRELPG